MDSHTKSARLTLCLTFLILITVIAAAVTLPWLTDWYICKTGRNKELRSVIMTVCYICLPAALAALYSLIRLLKNILDGEIFIHGNVLHLRLLSWYCAAVALITLAAGYFYLPFYLVGLAAVFFTLILRVIKNVFAAAIEIKTENELTV